MIYQLDSQGNIINSFKNLLSIVNTLHVGRSWLYELAKKSRGGSFICGGKTFIFEEDAKKDIKIGSEEYNGDDGKYSFANGVYHWKSKGQDVSISQELADVLFFEFSKHGMDLSQSEVRLRNNIGLRDWYSLKNKLQLYKDSDIFSPETRKGYTDEEYRREAANKIHELNAYKKKAVIDEYNKYHLNQAKKWRNEAHKNLFNIDVLSNNLSLWLDKQSHKTHITSKNLTATSDPLVVATADWHFGAGVKSEYIQPEYNPSIISSLIDRLVDSINQEMSEDVTLVLDGDFIESWMGLNHIDSWKSIEAGHIGAQVVSGVIEQMLEPLLEGIYNLKRVVAVGGNHDRGTNSNKEDNLAEIASVVFYFLRRFYPNIDFTYDPFCVSKDINNLRFIVQHGYFKAPYKGKEAGDSLVNDYGSKDLFNLVLTADKHTRGVLMDSWNRRHVKIPPMFTGNFYSTSLGFSSVSGCLFIYEDEGFPKIIDKSIYSVWNEEKFKSEIE